MANGGKNTLKTILEKMGATVPSTTKIDGYPAIAGGVDSLAISAATKELYGLGSDAALDGVLAFLGKYNQYWWKRRNKSYSIVKGAEQELDLLKVRDSSMSYTYEYSETLNVSDDGSITINAPQTVQITYGGADILKGKYFHRIDIETNDIYYLKPDAVITYEYSSPYYYLKTENAQIVSTSAGEGSWEYIQSSNRNTYPDSGIQDGYEYQFLDIPFNNAVNGAKIATGSYVGTGTYGESNPTIVTLNFDAKLLFIFCKYEREAAGGPAVNIFDAFMSPESGFGIMRVSSFITNKNDSDSGTLYFIQGVSSSGNQISFWANDASTQLNFSGYIYHYIAIG